MSIVAEEDAGQFGFRQLSCITFPNQKNGLMEFLFGLWACLEANESAEKTWTRGKNTFMRGFIGQPTIRTRQIRHGFYPSVQITSQFMSHD
jgi:hypothetical protein